MTALNDWLLLFSFFPSLWILTRARVHVALHGDGGLLGAAVGVRQGLPEEVGALPRLGADAAPAGLGAGAERGALPVWIESREEKDGYAQLKLILCSFLPSEFRSSWLKSKAN